MSFTYNIDDASPYVSYGPYGDGPSVNNGWRTWYTGSNYATSPEEAAQGVSYHITSSSNATASFQFFGTGVALYGVTNSSFDIIIDNGTRTNIQAPATSSTSVLLYSSQNLTNTLHTVTLSARPSPAGNQTQSLAFDNAIVSTPLDEDESAPSPVFYASTNTTMFAYSGDWASQTQNGVPNATVSAPFYQTTQVNASVSISFSGANAVVVKGLIGAENGMYSVSLDGYTSTYNGTSMWIIPDTLLYLHAGLDPTLTHQLNITNLSSRLCLNSITVFNYEPRNAAAPSQPVDTNQPSSHQTSVGLIAGPVAGCLLLLIAVAFFFWFRRRRRSEHDAFPGRPKFTFSVPKQKPIIPPRPTNVTIISPMLATFNQEDRSLSDARSTHNGTSSDVHSSTNLLRGAASHGNRSLLSNSSSDAALSISQSHMGSVYGWETPHGRHIPLMPSQYSNSSGLQSGPSVGSSSQYSDGTRQTPHRLTIETSVSSLSEFGSPRRRHPAPDYIPMSPRALPNIPVPSYDAALQAPELYPDEVKHIPSVEFDQIDDAYGRHRRARRYSALTALTTRTAPPQYEQ